MILTWYKLWPLLLISFSFPMLIGLLPDFNTPKGHIGGAAYQYAIIRDFIDISPVIIGNYVYDLYLVGEYYPTVIYLVLSFNIGVLLMIITYVITSLFMSVFNKFSKQTFKQTNKELK
jgi:hypothetical protein